MALRYNKKLVRFRLACEQVIVWTPTIFILYDTIKYFV